jgi:hypothetical protein
VKPKLYLETTIASYLAARPSRDLIIAAQQSITRDWWDRRRGEFDLYVSEFVLTESEDGDRAAAKGRLALLEGIPVLPVTSAIMELAQVLVTKGPLPPKAAIDAFHIATATAYGCEYLLSWNCKHIANAQIQRTLRRVATGRGFDLPTICTPEEFMGDEYELPQ